MSRPAGSSASTGRTPSSRARPPLGLHGAGHLRPGRAGCPADVTITATTAALASFIFGQANDVDIAGDARAVRRFRRLISTAAAVAGPG